MKQSSRTLTAQAARVVAALQEAVTDPSTSRNKAAAEAIVKLRGLYEHEGRPDWAGRSSEYRDAIERLYRQAGMPSDSESSVQANLRYHIGNTLRKTAPAEDLHALGMAAEGPLERLRHARRLEPKATTRRLARPGVGDPGALASLALETVRTLRTMEPGPEVEPALRRVLDEVLDAIRELPAKGNGAVV